jgi:hypothetical protein
LGGEVSSQEFFPLTPEGAKIFRKRLPQIQAESAYWAERIGSVHEFRMFVFDNDTSLFFTAVYDGDFKPYVEDLINKASQYFDSMFLGVVEGYKGMRDPGFSDWFSKYVIAAQFMYASNPDATRRDVVKGLRVLSAFEHLLDEAQS